MEEVRKLPANQEIQKEVARLNAENAQLKNILQQSNQRLKQAADRIQFLETNDFYRHLEWLWKIITLDNDGGTMFPLEFYEACKAEFISMMTPQKEEEAPVEQPAEEKKEE